MFREHHLGLEALFVTMLLATVAGSAHVAATPLEKGRGFEHFVS